MNYKSKIITIALGAGLLFNTIAGRTQEIKKKNIETKIADCYKPMFKLPIWNNNRYLIKIYVKEIKNRGIRDIFNNISNVIRQEQQGHKKTNYLKLDPEMLDSFYIRNIKKNIIDLNIVCSKEYISFEVPIRKKENHWYYDKYFDNNYDGILDTFSAGYEPNYSDKKITPIVIEHFNKVKKYWNYRCKNFLKKYDGYVKDQLKKNPNFKKPKTIGDYIKH